VSWVLVRGDLRTGERVIVAPPRDEPHKVAADALNQKHYEECFLEFFGKPANGNHTPNKRYIWFTEEAPQ